MNREFNFKDVSFMIHVRVDIPARLENLTTIMDYYHHACDNVEFIIVNDDSIPDDRLRNLNETYTDSKFLFQKNDNIYHRTRAFNAASVNSTRPFIIAGDTDVIVHPKYILQSIDLMRKNDTVAAMHPYNGLFLHVSGDIKQEIIRRKDINFLLEYVPDKSNQVPNYEDGNILVAHTNSQGGCIIYNHDHWNSFNGYNPNFVGWGYEDDEIRCRVQKLGYDWNRIVDVDAIAWHLPHPNTVKEKHPYYNLNKEHLDFVSASSHNTLTEYIQTWKVE